MNILLLGYGKMGKAIEVIAQSRGHYIVGCINIDNVDELSQYSGDNTDVAIEFSEPASAFANISYCLRHGIAVVSGTTGWLAQKPMIEDLCHQHKGTFFYASNYSIGVNLFFNLNTYLAKLMNEQGYRVEIEEIHHTQKKDAPSGTAITLAEGISRENNQYTDWKSGKSATNQIGITSKRIDPAPGTHTIKYSSAIDDIEIKHTAHSRQGFATGAVLVAEWVKHKKGVFDMTHFLDHLKK